MDNNPLDKNTSDDDGMDRHTISLLEFDRIRETVSSGCLSNEGQEKVLKQPFLRTEEEVEYFHDFTFLFRKLLSSGIDFPSLSFPPIAPSLENLDTEGLVLEEEQLHHIAVFLASTDKLKRFIGKASDVVTGGGETEKRAKALLAKEVEQLPDLKSVVSAVRRVINEEGAIREDLPELKSIREAIRSLNRQISGLAGNYFKDRNTAHFWQDTTPVLREGRIVLPLKANYRGKVQGIVHEVSSTGATLFIEPMDIVEKNNALIEQENRFRQEIHKILRRTTREVQDRREEIKSTVEHIAFIDSIYGRSRYGERYACIRPQITRDRYVLHSARHPLLGEDAVPISLEIADGIKALIISGPNTGGKTVSLKTAGLMVLLNQFGLGIPAEEGSLLPLYDGVFADIGDEQSIDQSLSTFSGHMKQIATIIEKATEASLILLDEIGSGTDVKEGSSLAMAFLDYFISKNCSVLATTHQGLLKHYGFTKPQIENASVDFDSDTLQPTYTVIQGVPGESHALDIAERHGISPTIIENAKRYLKGNESDIAQIIREMSRKQRELLEREKEIDSLQQNVESEREQLEQLRSELRKKEAELKREESTELRRYLNESRKVLENLIRELKEGEVTKEKTRKAKQYIEELSERTEEEEKNAEEIEEETFSPDYERTIEPGMEVYVEPGRRKATVVERKKNGDWIVATGSMRINVPENKLIPVSRPSSRKRRSGERGQTQVDVSLDHYNASPEYQIDVRGKRLDEAISAVERQIDNAVLGGLSEFHIVHGKGTGALQQGIHDYLKNSPQIEDYYFAHPSQGGFGKTIVKLRKK